MDSEDEDYDFDSQWNNLQTISKFNASNSSAVISAIANASTQLANDGLMSRIVTKATAPISLLVESLVQQLCAMLEQDPDRSRTLYTTICERLHAVNLIDETYAMGEFEMMRSQYQKALYHLVSVARGQDLPDTVQEYWPMQQSVGLQWSRYHREFDEVSYIAGGGFGKVYKARNKLDGIVYAVKKVTIRSATIKNVLVHLAEVKTLASLNHINIVPYKAAWLEPLLGSSIESKSSNSSNGDEEDDDDDEDNEDSNHISKRRASRDDAVRLQDETSDFSIEFLQVDTNNGEVTDEVEKTGSRQQVAHVEETSQSLLSIEETISHVNLKWATLYIQMTLCHLTLREWLDERNRSPDFTEFYSTFLISRPLNGQLTNVIPRNSFCRQNSQGSSYGSVDNDELPLTLPPLAERAKNHAPQHLDIVTDVFQQLLNGLNYIHSRRIVHHDIKPSNIFVSFSEHESKINIQLGDFGLACPLQSAHTGVGFGTPLYAAPEQLEGQCDPKSDIYSLGIILLELLLPFGTDMERAAMIKQVRQGKFPDEIDADFTALLRSLLQTRPNRRPDMLELVEAVNRIKINRDNVIGELRKSLSLQEEEISNLRLQIDEQSRAHVEITEKHILHTERTLRSLIIKQQELTMEAESKENELRTKDIELKSKDEEISKLKALLKTYQEETNNDEQRDEL